MNLLGPTDWEKSALRAGAFGAVFALVLGLVSDGLNWLISGKKIGQDVHCAVSFQN
jgi:hypothetical protein